MDHSGYGTYRIWTQKIFNIQDMKHTRHMVVLGGLSNACCSVCYEQNDMIIIKF